MFILSSKAKEKTNTHRQTLTKGDKSEKHEFGQSYDPHNAVVIHWQQKNKEQQ